MPRLRRAEKLPGEGVMPVHLVRWESFLPDGVDPRKLEDGQLMGAAFEARRRARREYLAELTVKPLGVGDLEWLASHGLSYGDRHSPAGRTLGY